MKPSFVDPKYQPNWIREGLAKPILVDAFAEELEVPELGASGGLNDVDGIHRERVMKKNL